MIGGSFLETTLGGLTRFRRQMPVGDVGVGICVLLLLTILIVPLPTFLLDFALALSFTSAILILLVSLSLRTALEFSSLPTLLLLLTIYRLSLNVATTRLILSHGNEGPTAAGQVVAAFGTFLMQGDVLVGGIIFTMILLVNFIVITKGAGRIAEVSARFYLDAMPGKQMAIDADLSAGQIDEKIARARRAELEEEIGFYGAMDGASKFVRGDAIAAVILTVINITVGLAIGVLRTKITLENAFASFATLTIGDGLVSQIPALLVSLAAGIVVSKGATDGKIHGALIGQLGASPSLLVITGSGVGLLALLPGLPTVPFLAIAGLAGLAAWAQFARRQAEAAEPVVLPPEPDAGRERLPTLDAVRVELGYGLLDLVSNGNQPLPEQIKGLRRAMASDLGFILPSVRIQDNMELGTYNYAVALKDIPAGNGELRPGMLLAICADERPFPLPGEKTQEPAFGLPACWIAPAQADAARAANCTIVDPASVLTTHLGEVVRDNIAELLSYADTQRLLADLPQEQQRLVADLVPGTITVGGFQRVLQALLAERISIRDMPTILEAVQEACSSASKAIGSIVAHVRVRLARQISDSYVGAGGYIAVIPLSPEWEDAFAGALVGPPEDCQLVLPQDKLQEFLARLRSTVEAAVQAGNKPVLLTSARIRSHVRSIVDRIRLNTPVIAQTEIHRRAQIKVVGTI
ncbi:flagellar biosynthesis protein FlhA [Rhodopila globiformis]|uniref:Flagellar biosynthesis protein FlhA n=1 Tax=Rhodopila globiformis TaxID=1071 RepID=A0A2S6MV06_RHOGL|nr:flagellar biosynthesis protein FlhA [Rhodopila globiformis]PPQ26178.1 flagellar biosynthesis protein FlhA [Rhodopila globiformis]